MKNAKSVAWQFLGAGQVVLALVFAASAITAKAQIVASESPSFFGTLSQNNSAVTVNGATACSPTSVINGLNFLNGVNGGSIFAHAPAAYGDVNSLATSSGTTGVGTSYGTGVTGMTSYFGSGGFNPSSVPILISGQYAYNSWATGLPANSAPLLSFAKAAPSASFLGNALNANDAVELALWWGVYDPSNNSFNPTPGSGSHEIDLYSLNLNASGNGSANIIVPEVGTGVSAANATAQNLSATIQTVTFNGTGGGGVNGSYLYLTYGTSNDIQAGTPGETDPSGDTSSPLDAVAAAPAFNPSFPTALIVGDYVEAVPEPSTYFLSGLGLMVLCVVAARRKAKV